MDAEYQADDQVRRGCRHRGANRVFEELAPRGQAQGEGDRPPRIGGIEVGSDHPRWHNGCGDGQSEERTHTHMQRLPKGMPLDATREKM